MALSPILGRATRRAVQEYWTGSGYRRLARGVGEDGIEPNVKYKVEVVKGVAKFVRAD